VFSNPSGKAEPLNRHIFLIAILIALLQCSCCDNLRTGDLVFVGYSASAPDDSSTMSGAIVSATGGADAVSFFHVAIVEVDSDTVWIVDASPEEGVARRTLDDFVDGCSTDGPAPVFRVMRLHDNRQAQCYVDNAMKFMGQPYDDEFLPDNGKMYCSELVFASFVDADGTHVFASNPMNFKAPDGTMPLYWQQHFAALGMPIPQNVPGTNPQTMSEERCLKAVKVRLGVQ